MREIVQTIEQRTRDRSGWARLEAACDVYLEQCADPTVLVVVFRDGPRVVPEARFQQLDREANEPLVTGLLQGAIDQRVLEPVPVELFARERSAQKEKAPFARGKGGFFPTVNAVWISPRWRSRSPRRSP